MNFVEELKWRGMIHDIMPGSEEQFEKEMTSAYIGFDPTADSLHIGSLVQIMTLVHLQRAGHKPFALVGGATGMVGDPSGRSEERNLLSKEVLEFNLEGIRKQLEKFLDFDVISSKVELLKDYIPSKERLNTIGYINKNKNSTNEVTINKVFNKVEEICTKYNVPNDIKSKIVTRNNAEIVDNYEWFKEFNFLDFIRDVGKHITVNYMMAKDSVKKRLDAGMSFTEFTYQLVQGYDFYYLHKNHSCKVQLGGSDQWGNIVTGTELIRRKDGGQAFAVTTPLIKKADGTKFGKTAEGNVWLDPERTSPYKFYQYWINASDEDAENFIKIFTLLTKEEVDTIINEHKEEPHLRILQKRLAEEVTILVHSKEDLDSAIAASNILFGKATTEELKSLDEKTFLSVFEGVPMFEIEKSKIEAGINVLELLAVETNVFPSKGELRRTINVGGASINKEKIQSEEITIGSDRLLNDKYILIQKGKKNYFLIRIV